MKIEVDDCEGFWPGIGVGVVVAVLVVGFGVGGCCGTDASRVGEEWRRQALEHHVGHFVTDERTGVTEFKWIDPK